MRQKAKKSLKLDLASWGNDPDLHLCSLAAQGLWIRLTCIAATSSKPGYLVVRGGQAASAGDIARLVGASVEEVHKLLAELLDNGVAKRDGSGTIYSAYLLGQVRRASVARANGQRGGNPKYTGKTAENAPKPIVPKAKTAPNAADTVPVEDRQVDMFGTAETTKKKKRESQLPEDFVVPTQWMREAEGKSYQAKMQIDWQMEADSFINHHRSRGNTMADWHAAWRTWTTNALKFTKNRQPANAPQRRSSGRRSLSDAFDRLDAETSGRIVDDGLGPIIDMESD